MAVAVTLGNITEQGRRDTVTVGTQAADRDRPQWLECFRCSLYHQTWDNIRAGNQPSQSKSGVFYGSFPGSQFTNPRNAITECVYCELSYGFDTTETSAN